MRDRTLVEQRCQGRTGQRRRSIFHLSCSFALLHSHSHSLAPRVLRRDGGAVGGAGPAQQWQDQPSDHVIKRKRCPGCSSVFDFALASKSLQCQRQRHLLRVIYSHWRAPFFAQQGEGEGAEEQSRQDARPCAAITRRRKHLNVFMWRLLSLRHLASQATTKMFPLLS